LVGQVESKRCDYSTNHETIQSNHDREQQCELCINPRVQRSDILAQVLNVFAQIGDPPVHVIWRRVGGRRCVLHNQTLRV
jgi:hypothetical protein